MDCVVPSRRRMLQLAALAAGGLALSPFLSRVVTAAEKKPRKVLFLTKSAGFEHSSIQRNGNKLGHAEIVLTEMGQKENITVIPTKDASIFNSPEKLAEYDAFAFYTSGFLTHALEETQRKDKNGKVTGIRPAEPAMTEQGKQNMLDAIAGGKGFIGFHSTSDSFHSPGHTKAGHGEPDKEVDPYIKMLGGEFIIHGAQQAAKQKFVSKDFPGLSDLKDFSFLEEWYSLKNFAPDLHVILAQQNEGMKGDMYQRPAYPSTWARANGKGRVFYSSMGHREDVWTNPIFQKVTVAGLHWVCGNVEADVTPNIKQVTPEAQTRP